MIYISIFILFIKAFNAFCVSGHISTANVGTGIFYEGQLNVTLYKKDYIHFHTFNRLLIEKYKSVGGIQVTAKRTDLKTKKKRRLLENILEKGENTKNNDNKHCFLLLPQLNFSTLIKFVVLK